MEISLMDKETLLATTYVKTRVPNALLALISFLAMIAGIVVPVVIADNEYGLSDFAALLDRMFEHFWDGYYIGFFAAGVAFIVMLLALMIGKPAVGSRLYITNARVVCVGNVRIDMPICQVTSVTSTLGSIKICTASGLIQLANLAGAAAVQNALCAAFVKQQLGESEKPETPAEAPVEETPVAAAPAEEAPAEPAAE